MDSNLPSPPDGETPPLQAGPSAQPVAGRLTVQQPKLCRSCRERMPVTCGGCGRKTPAYCTRCRPGRTDSGRVAEASDTVLDQHLEQMMTAQPLPAFAGITGWTAERAAVHLPGHSPATVLAALHRLADADSVVLIGRDPERYRLR